ncbi:PREDICTED: transmembrane protein 229B-like [Amphimedon queenslandica]|uniref:ABC-transporter type IV n=1 Tax=Amphimedon queenslandica TaxID=400682 RepID=A0A1X7TY45_AMPQE|nr:PREDICTED: transmembrane protein 229B-like [Amphimedon queenslandica]|eukprot:XP_011406571.1 PREDICTED: transmembrane protein 229B-like [Amphimedon queenslandica]
MLPWPMRLYFWGVHGVFIEVVFTGLWELFASTNNGLTLHGFSSIWSFFIYGFGTFLLAESVYQYAKKHHYPLPVRILFYILLTYAWEFSCGVILSRFGANSWDYSEFRFNVYGLITLEYAPFWGIAGLVFEYIMSCMEAVEGLPHWRVAINKERRQSKH